MLDTMCSGLRGQSVHVGTSRPNWIVHFDGYVMIVHHPLFLLFFFSFFSPTNTFPASRNLKWQPGHNTVIGCSKFFPLVSSAKLSQSSRAPNVQRRKPRHDEST